MHFDGDSRDELVIESPLIDGFVYRLPVELTVGTGVELDELVGKTICQCASLQFDSKRIAVSSGVVNGSILIRPKAADVTQTLDAFGIRVGELEPTLIAQVKINCKVFSPLRLTPSIIEVKGEQFDTSKIDLRVSKGVEILDAKILDSNSQISFDFLKADKMFTSKQSEQRLSKLEGVLTAEFNIRYKNTECRYVTNIPYAPRPTVRVVPSRVLFRSDDDEMSGRLIVIGFGPSETTAPSLIVQTKGMAGTWVDEKADFVVDNFSFGKAIGRIVLQADHHVLGESLKTQMRLVDRETKEVVVEFEGAVLTNAK